MVKRLVKKSAKYSGDRLAKKLVARMAYMEATISRMRKAWQTG